MTMSDPGSVGMVGLGGMGWVDDILAGGSLPLLYCLYTTQLPWAHVAGLALIGTLIAFISQCIPTAHVRKTSPLDQLMGLGEACLKILLNVSTLLVKAHRLDSDIGALLCLAPVLTLLAMQGASPFPHGQTVRWATLLTCGTCLLLCLIQWEYNTPDSSWVHSEAFSVWSSLGADLSVVVAAACSCETEGGIDVQARLALRNILYIAMAGAKVFLSPMLGESKNILSWVCYGMLLLQSSSLQARVIRRQVGAFGSKDPTRTLILVTAVIVAASYAWYIHIYNWAPWVGGGLLVLGWVRVTTRPK